MKVEMQQEENLVAVHEVLQGDDHGVMREMTEIDLEEADIGILFQFPRYHCIFPTVM